MAASRGPVPKRADQRRRTNKPEVPIETAQPVVDTVPVPAPRDEWHRTAREWYLSLAKSGQSAFFEPSDWAAAQLLADAMTRLLEGEKFNAQHFAAVWSGMTDLLTTEGSRRRVRLEIAREAATTASAPGVTAIDDYRARLDAS